MTPSLRDAQVAKLIAENAELLALLQQCTADPYIRKSKLMPEICRAVQKGSAALAEEQGE